MFKSGPLIFLLHQTSLWYKALKIIEIVFLTLDRPFPHNKFLHTPLYEYNCLKQNTKLP